MADLMKESILSSMKTTLGLGLDYDPFDNELLIHINSLVGTLKQLGVGPQDGLMVDENTKWEELMEDDDDNDLSAVRLYMFLRLKLIFDANSMAAHHITSYNNMIEEQEWRIAVAANPPEENMPPVQEDDDLVGP